MLIGQPIRDWDWSTANKSEASIWKLAWSKTCTGQIFVARNKKNERKIRSGALYKQDLINFESFTIRRNFLKGGGLKNIRYWLVERYVLYFVFKVFSFRKIPASYLVLFLALAEEISIRHDCKVINPQKSRTIVPSISPHCDIQKGIAKMPTPITELIRLTMWGMSLSISPSKNH